MGWRHTPEEVDMVAYVVAGTDLADRALVDRALVDRAVGADGSVDEVWRGLRIVRVCEPRTHDTPARTPPSGSRLSD